MSGPGALREPSGSGRIAILLTDRDPGATLAQSRPRTATQRAAPAATLQAAGAGLPGARGVAGNPVPSRRRPPNAVASGRGSVTGRAPPPWAHQPETSSAVPSLATTQTANPSGASHWLRGCPA